MILWYYDSMNQKLNPLKYKNIYRLVKNKINKSLLDQMSVNYLIEKKSGGKTYRDHSPTSSLEIETLGTENSGCL